MSIYLQITSNPCWGPRHVCQAAGILVELKIKKGGCNQYTLTKKNKNK